MKRKVVWLSIIAILLIVCFVYLGKRTPVKLSVKAPEQTVYAGDRLTASDFKVSVRNLIGRPIDVATFMLDVSDGNTKATVTYGSLKKSVNLSSVQADSLAASYDGSVYVGQPIDRTKLHVIAVYKDGTNKEVLSGVSLDENVVPNVSDVWNTVVHTGLGDVNLSVPVVVPTGFTVVYPGPVAKHSYFNKLFCDAEILYADGTTYRTQNFYVSETDTLNGQQIAYDAVKGGQVKVSVPDVVTQSRTLYAISPYGNVPFTVSVSDTDRLIGKYKGTIYQGEMLNKDNIEISLTLSDGRVQTVTDYTVGDFDPILYKTNLRVNTAYGTAVVPIDPIMITSVSPVSETGTMVEGNDNRISGIHVVYADGTSKDVDAQSLDFMDDAVDLKTGRNTVNFYFGKIPLSFMVYIASTDTASCRLVKDNMLQQGVKYSLSESDVDALTRIAQSMVGDDPALVDDEVSMMANRYELYDNHAVGDGSALLNYVKTSGYWGNAADIDVKIASIQTDARCLDVVNDCMLNGYRRLPRYVDERIDLNSVKSSSMAKYAENVTEISTPGKSGLRFYGTEPANPLILYCYSPEAYKKVTGEEPVTVVYDSDSVELREFDPNESTYYSSFGHHDEND